MERDADLCLVREHLGWAREAYAFPDALASGDGSASATTGAALLALLPPGPEAGPVRAAIRRLLARAGVPPAD
jgi:hypothetical protein